jgi:hypothetical protein
MKNYILCLFLISSAPLLYAEPRFDASSADAIALSSKEIAEAIQENPDIGMQDKGAMSSVVSAVLMESIAYALEKGGPNASQTQSQALMVEFCKKYNNMTAKEMLQNYLNDKKEKEDIENKKRQALEQE